MSTASVFATATSTIHADLIIVALKRVAISTSGISILYPSYSRPDSVLYWIDGAAQLSLSPTGETVTVSGPLRFALEQHRSRGEFPSLVDGLRALGLNEQQSASFQASLLEDRVVICVEARDDAELALIFHILHHIGAEKMVITETAPSYAYAGHRSEPSKAGFSLSAA